MDAKRTITRQMLVDWAGPNVVRDAETMVRDGQVLSVTYDPPLISGVVLWNNRPLRTSLVIQPDGTVQSRCPCWANIERAVICCHVIALALAVAARTTDPRRGEKEDAERRRADRMARIPDTAYVRRVTSDTPGAVPARILLTVPADWLARFRAGAVPVEFAVAYRNERVAISRVPHGLPLAFPPPDESVLYVIEDIAEGPAPNSLDVKPVDFLNLVGLFAGRQLGRRDGAAITIARTPIPSRVRMDLRPDTGEIALQIHTEMPLQKAGETAVHLVTGRLGWAYGADHLWPLENVLPEPYHELYARPILIERGRVLPFLRHDLPRIAKCARIESDITDDLFTVEPAQPQFHLQIRGSPASLSATLHAVYGDIEVTAGRPGPRDDFGLPDPEDLMRYTVRNPEAEKRALAQAAEAGFRGDAGHALSPIVGNHEVLNFLGRRVPALRRAGWRLTFEGKVKTSFESAAFVTPVVRIAETSGIDWFDVSFGFEDASGASLSAAEIQVALQKNACYVEKEGRILLIDADAIQAMYDTFADCASSEAAEPGHFRLSNIHAPFVKASLDALDGVDVEAPPRWRSRAEVVGRLRELQPVALTPAMDRILRPYQKEGVYWLSFLEANGFCGLLADEMGLGKTVQTLAWLQANRANMRGPRLPALVVCPSSIVENWAEEVARFTPDLRVQTLVGPDRHQKWDLLPRTDLAVTSYAILRRDMDRFAQQEFSVVVLDEAQHIKNRSTLNATAAKSIRCGHRLVLTGTPIENSVSDLWSIMDFLMPGYLGSHDSFQTLYEGPILRERPDADGARVRLRRKLQPFLLRRMKSEVARDLPARIERVSFCDLTPDQRAVYNELLQASRSRLTNLVQKTGFHKCRMQILTALLRLRQVCCHLDLLRLPNLKPELPSAKMDVFLELLDEAMDSGHRILVFSQFVSMLTILRKALDGRGLAYCYLDGSTEERMQVVHTFNSRRDIPVFLISLKAGGSGLNLTGADMVIHFDPWWNPAVENQATDRAHRIGQKRTVYSVKLITRGTVEEKVLALQERKKYLTDAVIGTDKQVVKSLTWEDFQFLLSL